MRFLVLLLGSLCFVPSALAAQHDNNDPGDHGAYTILFENDVLVAPDSDRDYTMGLALRKSFRESDTNPWWHRTTLSLLKGLDGLLGGDMTPTDSVWWELGSRDYTPRNLSSALPIYNDRPYASLLYLAAGYTRPLASGVEKRVSWQWGLLGTNIGREVQSAIHRVGGKGVHPNGWSHQIGEGVSPTFLFQEEWINDLAEHHGNHDFGLRFRYGYSLGYYTRAILGTSISYGLPPMDGGEQIGQAASLPAPADAPTPSGFSAWAGYELDAYAYNELLQGAWTGRSDVKFRYSQLHPLVHRFTVGVELTFIPAAVGLMDPKNNRLYVAAQWRSKMLKSPVESHHVWGGIYFTHYF